MVYKNEVYAAKQEVVVGTFGQMRLQAGDKVRVEDVGVGLVGVLHPHDSHFISNESEYAGIGKERFEELFELVDQY